MADRERVANYFEEHGIHDLLFSLLESLAAMCPSNPHQFIVDHMHKEYPRQVSKMQYIESRVEEDFEEEDDYEDEEDDTVGEMQSMAMPVISNAGRRRSGVSAERVDPTKLLANFKRPVYEKDADVTSVLSEIVAENFLFRHLDSVQFGELINAMFRKEYEPGDDVIVQGDEGDNFYVVYEGDCDVYVKKGGEDRLVLTCRRGDSFGELALMYGAPRAATVRANTKAVLYAIDRTTFQAMMVGAASDKTSLHLGFISKIQIFDVLTDAEKTVLADSLSVETFKDGEDIIRLGQAGEAFYIVEEGCAECYVPRSDGQAEVIGRCDVGGYFGEVALLTNRPRACSVRALGAVKLLSLQRKTFTRVMGPLQEILKRNMQAYNQYMGM